MSNQELIELSKNVISALKGGDATLGHVQTNAINCIQLLCDQVKSLSKKAEKWDELESDISAYYEENKSEEQAE